MTFFEDPASKGDVFNTTELRKIHLKLTVKDCKHTDCSIGTVTH